MNGIILSSTFAGVAVALLAADAIPFVRAWNTASALVPRRESLLPSAVVDFLHRMRSIGRKNDPAQWEEVCYSLAFHLRAGETPAQAVRGAAGEGESPAHSVLAKVTQLYDAGSALQVSLASQADRKSVV